MLLCDYLQTFLGCLLLQHRQTLSITITSTSIMNSVPPDPASTVSGNAPSDDNIVSLHDTGCIDGVTYRTRYTM